VRDPVTGRGTFVGSVDDVTGTVALKHRADHDDLTGLLSRRAFEERVEAILHERPGHGALGFVDLDRFKQVNDTHGHDAGDAVLVTVARRLRHALREDDEIGRYGGDEFVVFCPDMDDAETVADRLTHVCADLVSFDGGTWPPEASVGVVVAEPGEAVGHLLRRADQAMFARKRTHRADRTPVR
jgi:diguanylate cyclase (GGDEF)-like protein